MRSYLCGMVDTKQDYPLATVATACFQLPLALLFSSRQRGIIIRLLSDFRNQFGVNDLAISIDNK